MNNPMQDIVRPLVDNSIRVVSNTLSGSRDLAVNGAHFVAKGRKPLHVVTESGLRLNTISHKSVARLLNVQAEMIEGTLIGTAKRLETAANANSVRELVNEQVALLPATRDRLAGDARKMINVLTDTGEDIKELVAGTVNELSDGADSAVEKATKTTRRTTKRATNAAKRATAKTRKTAKKAKTTATRSKKKVTRKINKATK